MNELTASGSILFEVATPLGFRVRVTTGYWEFITTVKHPVMRGREADVQRVLTAPDEVRVSKSDPRVYLFYGAEGSNHWVCAVAKQLDGEGFLITTYRTAAIKEGTKIWPK